MMGVIAANQIKCVGSIQFVNAKRMWTLRTLLLIQWILRTLIQIQITFFLKLGQLVTIVIVVT